jgi:hypothetical protein
LKVYAKLGGLVISVSRGRSKREGGGSFMMMWFVTKILYHTITGVGSKEGAKRGWGLF